MSEVAQLHEAVKKGDLVVVQQTIAVQPDLLDATNDAGQSAFLLAKYYRQEEVARYLLGLGPKLDIFNAAVAGQTSLVLDYLAHDQALLHAHSTDGWTPLHLAAFFGQPELATVLIDRGAEVDARSTNAMKNTPLHAAAAGGQTAAVRLLLQRGANPNARQEGGWTALHGAAQSGNREMVEVLLAHNADPTLRADNNQSALDFALLKGHAEIAALLEALGAKLQ